MQGEFGAKRTAGVFHSLSAVTAAMHTQRMGARWDPLVLFDPPFYPARWPSAASNQQRLDEDAIAARAARRTPSYKDPMDLARQFAQVLYRDGSPRPTN